MINIFSSRARQQGAATLIISVILLTVGTLIIVFSANYGRMQTVTSSNMTKSEQAFSAAEAGLEYGVNYLKENYTAVIASPVSGYITAYTNASLTNVALASGSKFTVTITNPVANNYKLLQVTSVGTSADGTTTRTVSQQVQSGSVLMSTPTNPITAGDTIEMSGSSIVYNIEAPETLNADTVTFKGKASTLTASGGSSAGFISSDVSSGSSTSTEEMLNDYFGTSSLVFTKANFTYKYTNSGSTNYSTTLNGKTGTSIWIDQTSTSTVVLNGNTTLGTSANPVILVVNNGALDMSGNVNFSGFIFALGEGSEVRVNGSATTSGGMVGTGDVEVSGNASLTYSSSTLSNVQDLSSMTYFAKVPGTWRDY